MEPHTKNRLHSAYASSHAGVTGEDSSPAAMRDVIRHLPLDRSVAVVDIGCGQGSLVRTMVDAGYVNCRGIDISPEQIDLAQKYGTPNVALGDFRELLEPNSVDVVVATDFFEHLTKDEVVEAFDSATEALREGGLIVIRVPNAVSPFGGNYRHGDLTHETSFTPRSLQQLGAVAGLSKIDFFSCGPIVHGVLSFMRSVVWAAFSAVFKLALAAETGRLRGNHVSQNIVAVFTK